MLITPPGTTIMKPTITDTVANLMNSKVGRTRQKGIITLAKKMNINRKDAMFYQAKKIAIKESRKNG